MGRQFDKQHAITVIASADVQANRFAAYDGSYPDGTSGAKMSCGVYETDAAAGDAVAVTTGFSQLVVAEGAIDRYAPVKPGTDGKATAGAEDDCCGRALAAASDGQLVEVQLFRHVTTTP